MRKSLTPKEQTAASKAPRQSCGWSTLDAIAGNGPYMCVTAVSMSMSTRAGAGQPLSTRSMATPMGANHATQYRREQSLSLFPSVIHGLFERNAAPAKFIAGSLILNRYFRTMQRVLDSRWGKFQ